MKCRRSPQRGPQVITAVFASLVLLASCKGSDAAGAAGAGGPGGSEGAGPPTAARIDRLVEKTIIDFDEYLASLTSRRSINLYPQIAGYVRAIHFNPGDIVKAGTLLVEIDPGQQRALLRSLDANLQTRKAALAYAIQNDESSRGLVTAGVLGELDFQQRHSQRASAEADVKAAEAQLQAQSALLRFYSITAPIDGVVGDFPVKIGDYVDPQTRLTSVDQNKSVEAYVYVPITKANAIRKDTTIQLVDDSGSVVCEQKPSFISPQVSIDTQTVLVKATCPNKGTLRASQVLKARVVWSRRSGVTIPVSAVTREAGQYFAYVVEHNPEGLVAKQRPIEVGPIQDNDFVVVKGLEAGTEIVATNVQKVHDGAPLAPPPIAAPADKPTAQTRGTEPMFVDFFIKRPIFAAVCSILIVLAGAVCIPTLPIAQYPQISLPQVGVSAFYTGASAEIVESAVTIPLEQAINGVEGMKYISSTSGNDGSCSITVVFDPSRNLDVAAVEVQNRVASAQARLPNEVKQTGVFVGKNSSSFVLAMALYPEHGEYNQKFISNYADVFIKDALKRVPGVSDVQIFGERKFAMRVWVNPERLAQRGLTAADVVNALAEQNLQVPAGQIGQPPQPREKDFQISLQVQGRLAEASEFENIVLKADPDGSFVRIKDVGRAELGSEDYSTVLRFNGRTAIGLGILQLPTANALEVRNNVLKTIDRLSKRFPPGLKWEDAFDTTVAVADSVKEVVITLAEAILLVVAVIFIFLQTGNSTLIPAITIPVSLVGTFAFVKIFNFSINTLTLFGLTLATGLVVDDAIVVIENIQRHLDEEDMSLMEAASAGMKEVSGPVVATSLVLMAVFAPVAFLPGTTGRIYQQFSLTIAFSVAISMFNSLTLTPALSARLLKKTPAVKNIGFRLFDRAFDGFRRAYLRVLRWLLRWRTVTLLAYAAVLAGAVWLAVKVPTGFLPEEDQGYFIVMTQGPSGTSLGYTESVLEDVEKTIKEVPEVHSYFEVGGFSFGGNGPNRSITFIDLKPWSERLGAGQSASDIVNKLRGPLMANQKAMVIPFSPPSAGVGAFGGFQFEVEDQGGGSIKELGEATQNLVAAASGSKDLVGLYTGFTADNPQLYLRVDRDRAKQLNVPLGDIFQTLQILTGSEYVNDFTFANRAYRVYVQADQQFRGNPKDLTSFYTRSRGGVGKGLSPTGLPLPGAAQPSAGAMVSLGNLLQIEPRVAPGEIAHYNLFRSTEINGAPAPGTSSGEAVKAMEQIATTTLPPGFGFEWTGLAQEQIESGNVTLLIFGLALILVFLVLAAQYESFSLPFIVLLSVPLGLVGALGGQLIRGQANDVFCQVGLVMLIGLSAKNAILIVEFANQLREHGHSILDAAVESARERLRPIVMTSFAFILGVFPLVIATGSGAESRHSLGTTVFGGMLVSTIMNLFFVPALYAMIEGLRERVTHKAPHAVESTGAGHA